MANLKSCCNCQSNYLEISNKTISDDDGVEVVMFERKRSCIAKDIESNSLYPHQFSKCRCLWRMPTHYFSPQLQILDRW